MTACTYKLGEVLAAVIDHRGKTPTKLGGEFSAAGVPVLSAKNIKDGRVVGSETFRFVDHDLWNKWMPVKLRVGDVLLTSEAPLGEVAYVHEAVVQSCLGQRLFGLRARADVLDPYFLYYWLNSSIARAALEARASGTTAQGIRQDELLEVEIQLPDLDQQRDVANVLTAIDRRMHINRSMVRSLQSCISTIFRSWFHDFDPTVACSLGIGQLGVPPELADLFPSTFDEVDGQRIPAGWTVSTIGKEVDVVGGSTPSTRVPEFWEGGHCWLTPRDLSRVRDPVVLGSERTITDAGLARISSGILPEGTFLLSSRAPIGYSAVAGVPLAINQGFIAMKCTGQLSSQFVYAWVNSNLDDILARAGGTTFAEISKANFRPIPLVLPPREITEAFDRLTDPMMRRIAVAVRQNAVLASLRSTLLPALIRGSLSAQEAGDLVGVAE